MLFSPRALLQIYVISLLKKDVLELPYSRNTHCTQQQLFCFETPSCTTITTQLLLFSPRAFLHIYVTMLWEKDVLELSYSNVLHNLFQSILVVTDHTRKNPTKLA